MIKWFLTQNSDWQTIISKYSSKYNPLDIWIAEDIEAIYLMPEIKKALYFSNQKPLFDRKLLVFTSLDKCSAQVQNSLLKLLEEPPSYLDIIILTTSDKLLSTIRSRIGISDILNNVNNSNDNWAKLMSELNQNLSLNNIKNIESLDYLSNLRHGQINDEHVLAGYREII